jgi:hypothetical protein
MPRGIPNAKRDDTGMRYTMFHVPLASVRKFDSGINTERDSQTKPEACGFDVLENGIADALGTKFKAES